MKRKLVQQGHRALTMTLPAPWLREHNLKAGDELNLEETGKTLTISTGETSQKSKIKLDASNFHLIVRRFIRHSYIINDEMELTFKDKEVMRYIQKVIPELLGLEIIEEKKNSCRIKVVSDSIGMSFSTILRRAFLLLMSMGDELIEGIEKKDQDLLTSISHRDTDVNRFVWFCLRNIYKYGVEEPRERFDLFNTITFLEYTGDEYKVLATYALSLDKINPKIIKLIKDTNSYLRLYYEFFYDRSKRKALKTSEFEVKLIKDLESMWDKCDGKEARILSYIKLIHRQIHHALGFQLPHLKEALKS